MNTNSTKNCSKSATSLSKWILFLMTQHKLPYLFPLYPHPNSTLWHHRIFSAKSCCNKETTCDTTPTHCSWAKRGGASSHTMRILALVWGCVGLPTPCSSKHAGCAAPAEHPLALWNSLPTTIEMTYPFHCADCCS